MRFLFCRTEVTGSTELVCPKARYLLDIRQGGNSVLGTGVIKATVTATDVVDFVVETGGGTVQGTVPNAGSDWQNTTIVLVPEERLRRNYGLYKVGNIDSKGRFTLKDVRPGRYSLFAWVGIPSGAWQNAEFLSQFESKGVEVNLSSNETSSALLLSAIRPKP